MNRQCQWLVAGISVYFYNLDTQGFFPEKRRPLKNLAIFTILKKTMDFFEVTGGRVVSFRNVSVGEPAGPDLSGQCGGGKTPPWIHC
jgi:hypothetical protein